MAENKPPLESSLHDIVLGAMIAQAHAEIYVEQHPEHIQAIQKFVKQVDRAKTELVDTLRPVKRESRKKVKTKRTK